MANKALGDRVFLWKGEPIVDNILLADYVTPIMESLGIKFAGFGWHTFRRLHLSLMSKRGLSLFELRKQAGHANIRTTQNYVVDEKAGADGGGEAVASAGAGGEEEKCLKICGICAGYRRKSPGINRNKTITFCCDLGLIFVAPPRFSHPPQQKVDPALDVGIFVLFKMQLGNLPEL